MTSDLLWPRYANPATWPVIEAVPLADRGLPESTYALLTRAATRWPERTAVTVLPEAARWPEPRRRTFAELLADVHRYANLLHRLGVRRGDAVALMSPELRRADHRDPGRAAGGYRRTAQRRPVPGTPRRAAAPLRRPGARHRRPGAGPGRVGHRAGTRPQRLDAILVLRPTGAETAPAPLPEIAGVRIEYLGDLAASKDPAGFAGVPPNGSDLAALFHTGGTTGAPKLAAHTHANEVADAWMLAANSLFDADSAVFAALPLFHVNALVVTRWRRCSRASRWCGPGRSATANPRCSASSGGSSSTTGSPR